MMKSSPDLVRRDAAVAVAIEVLELTEDLLWNAFKFEKLPDEHLIMGGGLRMALRMALRGTVRAAIRVAIRAAISPSGAIEVSSGAIRGHQRCNQAIKWQSGHQGAIAPRLAREEGDSRASPHV